MSTRSRPHENKLSYRNNIATSTKGQPSGMAVKKNNPFTGVCPNDSTSSKQRVKMINLPRRQDSPELLHGSTQDRLVSFPHGCHMMSSDNSTFFDSVQVQQWAVNSATGPPNFGESLDDCYPIASQANDLSTTGAEFQVSGSFSSPRSLISHVCLPHSTRTSVTSGQEILCDRLCPAGAGVVDSDADLYLGLRRGSDFETNVTFPREDCSHDIWSDGNSQSYPTPATDDMNYSNYTALHPLASDDPNEEPEVRSFWPMIPSQSGDEMQDGTMPCGTYPVTWSPLSAVGIEPAVSSSYSHSNFLAQQPTTPISSTREDRWSSDQTRIESYDDGPSPTFGLPEVMRIPSPADYVDGQIDLSSTLRPAPVFQRAPLSSIDLWSQSEAAPAFMAPSYVDVPWQRRPSHEGEPTTAREHKLYQIGPQDDGLYHCPFAGKECSHKPEKLKCNYDKHLDSHLKPYRCKVHSCVAVPFSSTACLLRHEREAHGMHGHGEKPHLCSYEDCDRSVPGNGFPRRWNLFDHMKRVHAYSGPPSSNGSLSPTPSSASSHNQGTATLAFRKRRTSSTSLVDAPKRVKSTTGTKPLTKVPKGLAPSISQGRQRQSMQKLWQEQKAAIKNRLDYLDPSDISGSEQISADYAILHTIGINIRRQEAGQLADE